MKKCFKCGEEKPLKEFYAHPQMADGHVNKCKECNKQDVQQNYREHKEHYANYYKKRDGTPERKEYEKNRQRKRRVTEAIKYKAWKLVSRAIQAGRLTRQPCEICGSSKVEGHHEDYNKPLEVRWLCLAHHRAEHGQEVLQQAF